MVSSAITHDSCTVTIPNGDWTVVKTISYMFTIPQEFHHFYGWYIYIWCFSIPQTFLVVSGIVLTTKTSKWNHFCHTEKTNKTWRCHRIKNGKNSWQLNGSVVKKHLLVPSDHVQNYQRIVFYANNSGYIWLYDGIIAIYSYNIPGWWF